MKRPIGIVIIALIQAFVGIVLLFGGVALLAGNNSDASKQALSMANLSADTSTLVSIGVVTLILAVVELLLAFGLFQLRGWAWGLTVFVFAANVLTTVVDFINQQTLTQTQIVGGIIALLVLVYLLTPGVRAAFFNRTPAHA